MSTAPDGDHFVAVEVSDNDPGVPENSMCRIFEPFYTTKRNGLGLGLSICKTIIEAHGGTIRAENRPGGGASFIVVLPVETQ